MGQRSNNATQKDAQIKLKMEEYAEGMGQRRPNVNDAARKDVQV